jgi:hypothetical protein
MTKLVPVREKTKEMPLVIWGGREGGKEGGMDICEGIIGG